jgi:predicted nucleotidyltransferase
MAVQLFVTISPMSTLYDEILKAAHDLPSVAILVVFGSRARDTHRPDSDRRLYREAQRQRLEWREPSVVDQQKLSSRLNALESDLTELSAFRGMARLLQP